MNAISKGFLQISILIYIAMFFGIIALGEAGYLAIKNIEHYKNKVILQEKNLNKTLGLIINQQKEISEIKESLDLAKKDTAKRTNALEKTILTETKNLNEKVKQVEIKSFAVESTRKTQEESSQKKILSLEEKISKVKSYDATTIISHWRPLIANVECQFKYSDTGRIYQTSSGSGIAIKFDNLPSAILTNKHILTDGNGYGADSCSVKLLDSAEKIISSDTKSLVKNYDLGYIYINNPSDYFKNLTSVFPSLCYQKPSLGDDIVALGYPSIGSTSGLTATEGIISGFDGNYFITSAKVEQGNSGGAVILLKDNCLLGIPTFVTLGKVESLARILDIWTAVEK